MSAHRITSSSKNESPGSLRGGIWCIRWNRPSATRAASLKTREETHLSSPPFPFIFCAPKPSDFNGCLRRSFYRLSNRRAVASVDGVSASIPLRLAAEDKLDLLRYLDEFHYWHSLDDQRMCKRCGRTITGRQIMVMGLQGRRGKLRLQCPSAGCVSTPGDWAYANPVQAAKLIAFSGPATDESAMRIIASTLTHHGERAAKTKMSTAPSRHSIVAPAHPVRAVLARLVLLRPIATGLHAFRPIC
jgi:hypothetical protein